MIDQSGYTIAFLDWLACAYGGRAEPTSVTARAVADTAPATWLGTAGHVLDFDDTYGPGLSHLSAPTAPAALTVGAGLGATIGRVLDAYAAGFEAMAALAKAGHPELYERGWHPTAVTGPVGAATATAHLLGLNDAETATAKLLAVLGAGGLRAAFGTPGKSLQVGMAASQGVQAAVLAANGAGTTDAIRQGYATAYGAAWAEPDPTDPAVASNWIKAFPCCLQTHSSIEAAVGAMGRVDPSAPAEIRVHPRSRQAAPLDDVTTGLEAKFSIPYTVAFTRLYGAPGVEDFRGVDEEARSLARRITVHLDDQLDESAAVFSSESTSIQVDAALGSPRHPMTAAQLDEKVQRLTGGVLTGALADSDRPAADILHLLEHP